MERDVVAGACGRRAPYASAGERVGETSERPRGLPGVIARRLRAVERMGREVVGDVEAAVGALRRQDETAERLHRAVVRRRVRDRTPLHERRERERIAAEWSFRAVRKREPAVLRDEAVEQVAGAA